MTDTSVSPTRRLSGFAYASSAALVAGILGASAGALMARIAPVEEYLWLGLAMAPLWFVLEIFFQSYVEAIGYSSRISRILASVTLLSGFYGSWILLRP
jgi:hypothetical protein